MSLKEFLFKSKSKFLENFDNKENAHRLTKIERVFIKSSKYKGDIRINERNVISNLRRAILHYSLMRCRIIN